MGSLVAVAESEIDGLGVFATVAFAPGVSVLTIDDSRVVDAAHPVLPEERRHCDYLEGGKTVLMQIPERYINHSCRPNVFVRTLDGVRHVLALRPIRAGEEITYDYCINGYGDVVWRCNCRATGCRGMIHSDFFHLPLELQKEYLPLLDEWFRKERAHDVAEAERALSAME
ncbi:MAG TPA: SET domain-containing protein-lysine N-methyltransferase [Bryobacteraceae bacterium]|nr:SET domain-containing protein-lysine N-methyltransferase [Bryobacteraceae bacterium]